MGVVADLQCAVRACLACGASLAVAVADLRAIQLLLDGEVAVGIMDQLLLAAVWQAAAGSASAQVIAVLGSSGSRLNAKFPIMNSLSGCFKLNHKNVASFGIVFPLNA